MTSNKIASRSDTTVVSKVTWSMPLTEVLDINAASGSNVGPLCDKYGSLSTGTHCP